MTDHKGHKAILCQQITSYAAAIVDRFIRTIKNKVERYQKLNDTKDIIKSMKEVVEGYSDTKHSVLGKAPNEMTSADVKSNANDKRQHNMEIMERAAKQVQDKPVGVLIKKNKLDKGNKIKLDKTVHKVVGIEGYNFILDSGRQYPPKDVQVLK